MTYREGCVEMQAGALDRVLNAAQLKILTGKRGMMKVGGRVDDSRMDEFRASRDGGLGGRREPTTGSRYLPPHLQG